MNLSALATAIRTLTILPFPGGDAADKTQALPFLWVAGLAVAGLHLGLAWLIGLGPERLWPLIGLALCALNVMVTGALHLDGLADTGDAFGMVRSRERTLAILKDSRIGTFGMAAVVLALLFRVVSYSVLAEAKLLLWLLPCMIGSRALQGVLLSFVTYARPEGGTATPFSGNRRIGGICLLNVGWCVAVTGWGLGWIPAIVATAGAFLGAGGVVGLYQHRLGGITGDGVGAATEGYEIMFMATVIAVA